jgi:multidrug efflux pump subunit AcrA (membrane-fusion protein)
MAIDEVPRNENIVVRQSSGPWVIVFVVLGLLLLGEIYTLSKVGSIGSVQAEQASLRSQVQKSTDQLMAKLSSLEGASAQQLDALRGELDTTSQKMGKSDGKELARARAMVAKLQKQTEAENDVLKQDIAKNNEQNEQMGQQMAGVTQDVTATKSDLGTTKQTVSTLQNDLGLARSEMGTLIARNHDDVETLRKLGQRNYYEFTLNKNQEQTVAGVGLILKKTNVKYHRFNVNLLTNDIAIPKDNRTIDEPVFFATGGSKEFSELVVNKVDQNTITGYISTPKYSQPQPQLAASTAPSS